MAYCQKCGTQLAEGGRWCPKCGEPVQTAADVNHEIEEKVLDLRGSAKKRKGVPGVLWILPVLFGFIGGIIASLIVGSKYRAPWARYIVVGVVMSVISTIVIIGMIGAAANSVKTAIQSPPANQANAQTTYLLQTLSMNGRRESGYNIVSGEVKNISSGSLSEVEAVVSFYTANGTFVKTDNALIQYNPVLAGQTSPWEVMTTDNPLIDHYKVDFQYLFGGTIPSQDMRSNPYTPPISP